MPSIDSQFQGDRDLDRLNPAAHGLIECLSDVAPCLPGTKLLGQMTKQRAHSASVRNVIRSGMTI
jgi:hypothetical protein